MSDPWRAFTEGNLGNAHTALGDPRKAIEYYKQRLEIARQIGDRRGEAETSWNLDLIYEKEGRFAEAADVIQVLVDFLTEIGHPIAAGCAADLAEMRAAGAGCGG